MTDSQVTVNDIYALNGSALLKDSAALKLLTNTALVSESIVSAFKNGIIEQVATIKRNMEKNNITLYLTAELDSEQIKNINRYYGGYFNIDSSRMGRAQPHGYEMTIRHCDYYYNLGAFNILGNMEKTKILNGQALVKDVGSCPTFILSQDICGVHCCMPCLSHVDAYRHNIQHNMIKNFRTVTKNQSTFKRLFLEADTRVVCRSVSEICHIRSKYVMWNHSTYDMTPRQLSKTMDSACATMGAGSYAWDPRMYIDQSGKLEHLNFEWRIEGDRHSWNSSSTEIVFRFADTNGQREYRHNLQVYLALNTTTTIPSDVTGVNYIYDIKDYFLDTVHFIIVRNNYSYPRSVASRAFITTKDISNDYVMCMSYEFVNQGTRSKLRPIRYAAPRQLVEKSFVAAIKLKDTNFTLNNVIDSIVSFNQYVVINGQSIGLKEKDKLSYDKILNLSIMIHYTAWRAKYEATQTEQRWKADDEAIRMSDKPYAKRFLKNLVDQYIPFFKDKELIRSIYNRDKVNSDWSLFDDDLKGKNLDVVVKKEWEERNKSICRKIKDWFKFMGVMHNKYFVSFTNGMGFLSITDYVERFHGGGQNNNTDIYLEDNAPDVSEEMVDNFLKQVVKYTPKKPEMDIQFEDTNCSDEDFELINNKGGGLCMYMALLDSGLDSTIAEMFDRLKHSKFLELMPEEVAESLKTSLFNDPFDSDNWPSKHMLALIALEYKISICCHDSGRHTLYRGDGPRGEKYHLHIDSMSDLGHISGLRRRYRLPTTTIISLSTLIDPMDIKTHTIHDISELVDDSCVDGLMSLKKRIFSHKRDYIDAARKDADKLSSLGKCGRINRSGLKLKELFIRYPKLEEHEFVLDLCGGPGGFVQELTQKKSRKVHAMTYIKCSANLHYHSSLNAKFVQHRGSINHLDGDITKLENIMSLALNLPDKITFVTCDGLSEDKLNRSKNLKIFAGEIVAASMILQAGGDLFIKFVDVFDPVIIYFMAFLQYQYRSLEFIRLLVTRDASSEFYVLARGFKASTRDDAIKLFTNGRELGIETSEFGVSGLKLVDDFARFRCPPRPLGISMNFDYAYKAFSNCVISSQMSGLAAMACCIESRYLEKNLSDECVMSINYSRSEIDNLKNIFQLPAASKFGNILDPIRPLPTISPPKFAQLIPFFRNKRSLEEKISNDKPIQIKYRCSEPLEELEVPGDGLCGFYSLMLLGFGSIEDIKSRMSVSEHLTNTAGDIKELRFLFDNDVAEWMSGEALSAISMEYDCRFCIHLDNDHLVIGHNGPLYHLKYSNNHYTPLISSIDSKSYSDGDSIYFSCVGESQSLVSEPSICKRFKDELSHVAKKLKNHLNSPDMEREVKWMKFITGNKPNKIMDYHDTTTGMYEYGKAFQSTYPSQDTQWWGDREIRINKTTNDTMSDEKYDQFFTKSGSTESSFSEVRYKKFFGPSFEESNMFMKNIESEHGNFSSSEQMYMYFKCLYNAKPDLAKRIKEISNPFKIKAMCKFKTTKNWDLIKCKVMAYVLKHKFKKPWEDANVIFVEASEDMFWGSGYPIDMPVEASQWKGKNCLGKILTILNQTLHGIEPESYPETTEILEGINTTKLEPTQKPKSLFNFGKLKSKSVKDPISDVPRQNNVNKMVITKLNHLSSNYNREFEFDGIVFKTVHQAYVYAFAKYHKDTKMQKKVMHHLDYDILSDEIKFADENWLSNHKFVEVRSYIYKKFLGDIEIPPADYIVSNGRDHLFGSGFHSDDERNINEIFEGDKNIDGKILKIFSDTENTKDDVLYVPIMSGMNKAVLGDDIFLMFDLKNLPESTSVEKVNKDNIIKSQVEYYNSVVKNNDTELRCHNDHWTNLMSGDKKKYIKSINDTKDESFGIINGSGKWEVKPKLPCDTYHTVFARNSGDTIGSFIKFSQMEDGKTYLVSSYSSMNFYTERMAILSQVNCNDFAQAANFTTITAGPGCGKSYMIEHNAAAYYPRDSDPLKSKHLHLGKPKTFLILASTKKARDSIRDRILKTIFGNLKPPFGPSYLKSKFKTIDSLLINGSDPVEDLWIDEALMIHPGAIFIAVQLVKATNVYLLGDFLQIPFINRLVGFVMYHAVLSDILPINHVLDVTRRCPADVVASLHKYYDSYGKKMNVKIDFKTTSKVLRSLSIKDITNLNSITPRFDVQYICFTKSEKQDLNIWLFSGKSPEEKERLIKQMELKGIMLPATINEYQGNQHAHTIIYRGDKTEANALYSLDEVNEFVRQLGVNPHALSCISRHTDTLTYLTMQRKSDALTSLITKANSLSDLQLKSYVKIDEVRYGDVEFSTIIQSRQVYRRRRDIMPVATLNFDSKAIFGYNIVICFRKPEKERERLEITSIVKGKKKTIYLPTSFFEVRRATQRRLLLQLSMLIPPMSTVRIDATIAVEKNYCEPFSQMIYAVFRDRNIRYTFYSRKYIRTVHPNIDRIKNVEVETSAVNDAFDVVYPINTFDYQLDNVVDVNLSTIQDFLDCHYVYTRLDLSKAIEMMHTSDFVVDVGVDLKLDPTRDEFKHPSFGTMEPELKGPMPYMKPRTFREDCLGIKKRNGAVPRISSTSSPYSIASEMFENFKLAYIDNEKFQMVTKDPISVCSEILVEASLNQKPEVIQNLDYKDPMFLQSMDRLSFEIKRNPKPHTLPNEVFDYPAVQTIVYPSKEVNLVYCAIWREIRDRVVACLNDNTVIYTQMTPKHFAGVLTNIIRPSQIHMQKILELDLKKYDKSQELIALLYECLLMRSFGTPEYYTNLWFNSHIVKHLMSSVSKIMFSISLQRNSGDGGTFFGNTMFLMGILSYCMIQSIMKCKFMAFCGDDSVLIGPEFESITHHLANIFSLEAKILDAKGSIYFCSKYIIPILDVDKWDMVPAPEKAALKICRSDMINPEHVKQYHMSFADNMISYGDKRIRTALNLAFQNRYRTSLDIEPMLMEMYNLTKRSNFLKLYKIPKGVKLDYARFQFARFD